jgi:hypothetical protein
MSSRDGTHYVLFKQAGKQILRSLKPTTWRDDFLLGWLCELSTHFPGILVRVEAGQQV